MDDVIITTTNILCEIGYHNPHHFIRSPQAVTHTNNRFAIASKAISTGGVLLFSNGKFFSLWKCSHKPMCLLEYAPFCSFDGCVIRYMKIGSLLLSLSKIDSLMRYKYVRM